MAYYCFAVAVSKSRITQVALQAVEGGFVERRLDPVLLPIIEGKPANSLSQPPPVNPNQILECPRISVICPKPSSGGNAPIRFQASVIGGKPLSEVSYGWSVNKGKISMGQGTAVIQVDIAPMELAGLTATVEINGFDPNCPRVTSCSPANP